jgi:oligoribonuclease NrnB/cAMP/cGMP phosphodiesterase (DHH superfamily)
MSANHIYILTPFTLDGAGSCAVIKWFLEDKDFDINIKAVTKSSIEAEYNFILQKDNIKKIYVVGGYLVKDLNLISDPRVTIFSLESDNLQHQQNKVVTGSESTYTQFLYNSFSEKLNITLEKTKKLLIDLIIDYNTYRLKHEIISIGINTVFSSVPGKDKVETFLNKFKNGFNGFSEEDKQIIIQHAQIKKDILNSDKYIGEVSMGGKNVKVVSVFGENCMMGCVNEVAHELLNSHGCDIAIIVNPSLNFVSFRKSLQCDVNLKKLAQKLCNGDGKEYASSGKMTETFLNFTKLLTKL